jgi:hypothetical protein
VCLWCACGGGGTLIRDLRVLQLEHVICKERKNVVFLLILNQYVSARKNVCLFVYIQDWKKFVHCKISAEKNSVSVKKNFSCMLPLWPRISINCVQLDPVNSTSRYLDIFLRSRHTCLLLTVTPLSRHPTISTCFSRSLAMWR